MLGRPKLDVPECQKKHMSIKPAAKTKYKKITKRNVRVIQNKPLHKYKT